MDYRPVPAAHREAARRLVSYAFDPASGPDFDLDVDADTSADADADAYDARGVYDVAPGADVDGDDLAATCRIYRFDLRVRDEWTAVGGLSAVASAPESRRRGHVGAMLDGYHRELRDDGIAFSALWPFSYGFYRRFGYEQVAAHARVTLPPDGLSAVAADPAGSFVALDADDWAAADEVYRAWATEPLAMARPESFWRTRVFEHWSGEPYVRGWRDDDGALRAYVVYRFEDGDDGSDDRTMVVTELAATDPAARAHCYRLCRDHDSQVGDVRLSRSVPAARRLLAAVDDPYAVDVAVRPGAMLRAIDLPAAVAALSFPAGARADLTVAVADESCPWNDGRYALRVADGAGRAERLGDRTTAGTGDAGPPGDATAAAGGADDPRVAPSAGDEADVDVRATVGALSAVLVGGTAVEDLVERGSLAGADAALATLAACCPPVETHLREAF